MRLRNRYFYLLLFGMLPALASAQDVPIPRPRPPLASDVKVDEIVPIPIYAYEPIVQHPYVVSTSPTDAARQAHEAAKRIAEAEARAQAEIKAAEAEALAVAARAEASTAEFKTGEWERAKETAKKNLNEALHALKTFENQYGEFVRGLNENMPLIRRSEFAGTRARFLTALLNVEAHRYQLADMENKLAQAKRVLKSARMRASEAEWKAVQLRNAAHRLVLEAIVDVQAELRAKSAFEADVKANGQPEVGPTADDLKKLAQKYHTLKAELDEAQKIAKDVELKLANFRTASAAGDQARLRVRQADQEYANMQKRLDAALGAKSSAEEIALSRVNLAEKRLEVAKVKADVVEALKAETAARSALESSVSERLVRPVKSELADRLLALEEEAATQDQTLVASYIAERKAADETLELAKARQQKILKAGSDWREKADQLKAADDAVANARAALESAEKKANGPFMGGEVERQTAQSEARADLARARAEFRAKEAALALLKAEIAERALKHAQTVAETESDLLRLLPRQTPDLRAEREAALQKANEEKSRAADADAKAKELARIAKERSSKIQERKKEVDEHLRKYSELYKKAKAADSELESIRRQSAQRLKEQPLAGVLIDVRVKVAEAVLVRTEAWKLAAAESLAHKESLLRFSEAIQATEAEVSALASHGEPDLRVQHASEVEQARQLLASYEESIAKGKSTLELAKKSRDEVQEVIDEINRARADINWGVAEAEKAEKAKTEVQKEYDALLAAQAEEGKILEKRIVLDRQKAKVATALSSVADAEKEMAEYYVRLDEVMDATPVEVVAVYRFQLEDKREAHKQALEAATLAATRAAATMKSAGDLVISARIAARTLPKKQAEWLEQQEVLDKANREADDARVAAAEAKQAALAAEQAAAAKQAEIQARPLPVVQSDSRISSYMETQVARKKAQNLNVVDSQRAALEAETVERQAARAELEAARKAFEAAKQALTTARAKFNYFAARRDGYTADKLAVAVADLEIAKESLGVAGQNLEAAYDLLVELDRKGILTHERLVTALGAQGDEGSMGKIMANLMSLRREIEQLEAARKEDRNSARMMIFNEMMITAGHGEELTRIAREVSLDDLAEAKAEQLAGHHCRKNDTDPIACLVCNTFYEAGIDKSFLGKLLPGRSVMVRYNTKDQPFGKSVCGIVHKRSEKGVCQYSWSCEKDSKSNNYHRLPSDIRDEVLASLIAYYEVKSPYSYDHYWNASLVSPYWANTCKVKERIGLHTACRIRKPIDKQEFSEEALMRVYEDRIELQSITEVLKEAQ